MTTAELATLIIETLDAQQAYFKAAKLLQKGIGSYENKNNLYKLSLELEKKLRAAALEVTKGPQPTQSNLF